MKDIESSQLKSSTRIVSFGFIVMILLVTLFSFMALLESKKHAELINKIYQHPFSVSIAVLEANANIISMHRYMKDVVLASSDSELETAVALVEAYEQKVLNNFTLIQERFLGDKEKINTAYTTFINWKPIREEVLQLKRNEQHRQAAAITTGKGAEHVKKLNNNMSLLINFTKSKAREFKSSSQTSYNLSRTYYLALLLITIIACAIIAFLVVVLVRKVEREKYESEERFAALFNNAEVSIWSEDFSQVVFELDRLRQAGVTDLKEHLYTHIDLVWDLVKKVKVNYVNNATLKLFGAKNQAEFKKNIDHTFGHNAHNVFIEELCAIWNKQPTFISEANFRTLAGEEITALISFQTPYSTNNFKNIPISIVDISKQKRNEEKLKLSSRVFKDTHEGIIITSSDSTIVDVNPAFTVITGYQKADVLGKNPNILSSGNHPPEFFASMWQQLNDNGHWQGEIWNRRKSGEVYAELLTISSLKNTNNKVVNYLGMFTDITRSKQQQEGMRRLAHYDTLTSLPNRSLLLDRFSQASAHAKRSDTLLAVCFLDLDNFKPVNDTFGHDIGDKLLVEVAHRLESAVRAEDTVCRLGGDEFSILLVNIKSSEQCHELLERIIVPVSETYFINHHKINISASIGISLFPADGVELDSLLRHADHAMYKAKQEGKNSYQFFDIEQSQKTTQRHLQLQEIQHALDNDELCLYYQPKVNMATGDIIGIEALIRWQHPHRGLISPIEFLPLIEGSPIEIHVGNWVIEQGLNQLEHMKNLGIDIEMSVNVSSMQFLHPEFFSGLSEALERHPSISPLNFNLEVLESSTLGNLDLISQIIKTCRDQLGVSIALDDFGTGYSSLSHLRQLPADTIKIDQSFVRDVITDPNDFAIIDGVIVLAKSFNRHIIAEGVESTEHGLMLLLMGCENAQGYAVSKPMPAQELESWIKNYQPNQAWLMSQHATMSQETRRIKQLELALKHSLINIEHWIHEGLVEQIDIQDMDGHFDKWLQRFREEQLFDSSWINKLTSAYKNMHKEAKIIANQYRATPDRIQREALTKLHHAYQEANSLLNALSTAKEEST